MHLLVFALVLLGAKFGQYLYFEWDTSPALLWPPTGIAIAAIWLGGYRFAIPVFLALLIASLTGPGGARIVVAIASPIAEVGGHIAAVYLLRRYGFTGTFSSMRHVLLFLLVIAVACMISPAITTTVSYLAGYLDVEPYLAWTRLWAGFIFSSIILTPLILTWVGERERGPKWNVPETIFVSVLLLLSVYFLFWTDVVEQYSFILFFLFLMAHFWIALRLSSRAVTLSMFVTVVFGIVGLFLSPNPERALNEQLFATELFLFLVAPIFYGFSALVKERANTIVELKDAVSKVQNEIDLKNNFISVLAHELRNPLAPVKTTIEILGLQESDKETQLLIKNAHWHIHSMGRLLDDLLDITRVTQGKFQLQIERVNLCEIINQSVDATRELFSERNHRLIMTKVCDDSIWLDVDPVRFEQVIVNILNNAAKYTEPGGVIEISHTVSGNVVEVRVKDNGIGIDTKHSEHIFESFWQIKNSPQHTRGGIGVGLALTKYIVEIQGGTIQVESEGLGKGSTFIVQMPAHSVKQVTPRTPGIYGQEIPSFRIFVVDDNEAAAKALVRLFTLKNHEVAIAHSGEEALRKIPEFNPEIILLDIGLPDMSGHDVAGKLKASGFKGRIIALSGYGTKEDKERALSSGFDHHITKPMSINHLEEYLITIKGPGSAGTAS